MAFLGVDNLFSMDKPLNVKNIFLREGHRGRGGTECADFLIETVSASFGGVVTHSEN